MVDYSKQLKLAQKQMRYGQFAKVIESYTALIEIDPFNADLYSSRGLAYYLSDKPDEAWVDYLKAIDLGCKQGQIYWHCAGMRDTQGDIEGALYYYAEAAKIAPSNALTFRMRGHLYKKTGKIIEALKDYYAALILDPNESLSSLWGYSEERCIADFSALIETYPTMFELYFLRANAKLANKDKPGALADLDQAIKLNPEDRVLKAYVDELNSVAPNHAVDRAAPKPKTPKTSRSANKRSAQTGAITTDKSLPAYIQTLIHKTLDTIRTDSTHQFLPVVRRDFYTAISPENAALGWRVRGWAAVFSAKRVLPIFTEAFPEDTLPGEAIQLAEQVLQGLVTPEAVQKQVHDMNEIAQNMWGYPDEEVPANVMLAGWAANNAALEALHVDPLLRFENYVVFPPGGKARKAETDPDIAEHGDNASQAAMATAADAEGVWRPDQLLAFWEWWLLEALPAAWKLANS